MLLKYENVLNGINKKLEEAYAEGKRDQLEQDIILLEWIMLEKGYKKRDVENLTRRLKNWNIEIGNGDVSADWIRAQLKAKWDIEH